MSPDWNDYVRQHLPNLGLRPERESEIATELAEQMRQAYQEWLELGHTEADAVRHAKEQIRDWESLAGELRDAERPAPLPLEPGPRANLFTALWFDVRYALRGLRGNPIFAAVAILTLAFAIGGNTAIFTVVDHIALRGLPYPDSGR